jgi:hypothetical protein
VKRFNQRMARPGQLLMLLTTIFVSAVFAQDAVVPHDSAIPRDKTIGQQATYPIGWEDKLRFHALSAYGPAALAGAAVYDGFLQGINFPREWKQGWPGYGKRLGSTLAYSGVRNLLGFGLDSALHQDPRYYRATERGKWRRTKHVFRETILTHTDSGGERLATWRLGSAYGAAFISNEW